MTTWNPLLLAWQTVYQFIQLLLAKLLSPNPPPPSCQPEAPANCYHWRWTNCQLGGIWARVNHTSGLQIHSLMYRFFPSIQWKKGYPNREEILENITAIWNEYGLEKKTKFGVKVEKVWQDENERWIVNGPEYGKFDGIIAAIGTCGDPKMPHIPGQEKMPQGKKAAIIGGGASAVEALEYTSAAQAEKTFVLSRSEKWIIPRNALVDMLLATNIFGQEILLSWIPEKLLRVFFYRDLEDVAPPSNKGLFTETPMVNFRCPPENSRGQRRMATSKRAQGVPPGGPGHEINVECDIVIMATGFSRPKLGFLPEKCFEEPYAPPNWYLQTFPPGYMSVCANNCTYVNAIGTVGNYHIGIYTRILLMFLVDPLTRPNQRLMRAWIDMTRVFKIQLLWWYLFCVAINPFRWKWALFVFYGIGQGLPMSFVEQEDRLREKLGWDSEATDRKRRREEMAKNK
ncbi:hypothetical protein BT96DRAFT_913371 [Gymnopus androsaceus JB14]|uniref:FAD/NAD(P)-binding domain-containing protein n=1 Tax=Gymnopus androsaceus JB14 TaxID=1447944 RepID=A0A6A4IJN6_9AGAR|nr:hypothetical protein BT96DRAFT_913371 [Gymnopus androsaceus JB14]